MESWHLLKWIMHIFVISKLAKRNSLIFGILLFILESSMLILSSFYDSNFFIPGESLGLLEHYGIWTILVGDLIIFYVLSLLMKQIKVFDKRVPRTRTKKTKKYLSYCKKVIFSYLTLEKGKWFLYFMMMVGVFAVLNNARQTLDPIKYYGNDVFDSITFFYSYISTRFILGTSWIIIYPILMYTFIVVAFSIKKILNTMIKNKLLKYDIYHIDKSGGFLSLGTLSILLIVETLVIYCELIVVLFTHGKINPGLLAGFIIISLLFVYFTFFLYPIIKYLKQQKIKLISNNFITLNGHKSCFNLTTYMWIHNYLSFSPYSYYQNLFIRTARVIPLLITLFKIKLLT